MRGRRVAGAVPKSNPTAVFGCNFSQSLPQENFYTIIFSSIFSSPGYIIPIPFQRHLNVLRYNLYGLAMGCSSNSSSSLDCGPPAAAAAASGSRRAAALWLIKVSPFLGRYLIIKMQLLQHLQPHQTHICTLLQFGAATGHHKFQSAIINCKIFSAFLAIKKNS